MKTLIAIKSCVRDELTGCNQAIRDTWGKDIVGADLQFFVGTSMFNSSLVPRCVSLPVLDDYNSLPWKTLNIVLWSLRHGYDFTFLCDTDTFIVPSKLLTCGYEKFDYVGRFNSNQAPGMQFPHRDCRGLLIKQCYGWASGGVGYFLSKRAMQLVATKQPSHWAEDLWVGQVLGPQIAARKMTCINPAQFERHCSWHHCSTGAGRKYDPQWMLNAYAKGKP